jgi:DNA-binding transcriptional LysR family regulator
MFSAVLLPDSHLATGYRHFVAVATLGSVRAASRQLNVAASAISRQVGLLEAQLGIALFERHTRSLALTEAGVELLRGLQAANQTHEGTIDLLARLKGITRGRVNIAVVESLSISFLPDLLIAFSRKFPGVQAAVAVAGSDTVMELVREREADVGVAFNPTALDGLTVEFERSIALGATMAPTHPLAKAKSLTLAQCLEYPVAWPARELSIRLILDRALGARTVRQDRLFECNSLRLMAALARDGGCIAFQTLFGIERDVAEKNLVFIPLSDRKLPPSRVTLVHRPGLGRKTAAGAFLDLAKQRLPRIFDVRK